MSTQTLAWCMRRMSTRITHNNAQAYRLPHGQGTKVCKDAENQDVQKHTGIGRRVTWDEAMRRGMRQTLKRMVQIASQLNKPAWLTTNIVPRLSATFRGSNVGWGT